MAIGSFLLAALGYAVLHRSIAEFFQFWTLLGASAPLVIFGAMNWVFDHYCWRWALTGKVLALIHVPVPPYLGGDYEVCVKWHDPHPEPEEPESGEYLARMTVIQTWRKISVTFAFRDTPTAVLRANSTSRTAFLECTADPRRVVLEYTYAYRRTSSRASGKGIRQSRIHGNCHTIFDRTDDGQGWMVYGDYYADDGGTGTITQLVPHASGTASNSLSDA